MSREILEATRALAAEKGIPADKLFVALEDALLSAYKKQPGSAKYARVEIDHATGDFKVFELIIPERLEAQLLVEAIDEDTTVDPVGACVGPRGSRVRMVVSELRGEKIDIIPYNDEPARFVAKALSPARVREVLVDDEKQESTVIVPDDQLSLAIGREGQNARLAAKLTGWKVDIKSETEFSQEEEELSYEGAEEVDGRCAAVLSAGRRCPNASLQGSRYCGLPQHQALARFETNQVTVLAALNDEEIQRLADPDADEGDVRPLVERAIAQFEEPGSPEEPEASETPDLQG